MAPHGWRKSSSVGDWLHSQGERWSFFQAIALLENEAEGDADAYSDHKRRPAGVGTGPSPQREVVKLRSSVAMSFPPSEIESIQKLPDGKTEITARLLPLAGALGPMPLPYAELLARRTALRDFALRDFLDIFNHRLLSLYYRAKKRHRIGLGVRSPMADDAARYLYALIGLGSPGLRDRLSSPDRALLYYSGILSRPVRTMAGLEAILRAHFGIAVHGKPLTGRLCPIEEQDRTAIGRSGRRRALGRDAVAGGQVWIQDAAFELTLGPLSADQVERYLPGGDALKALCVLTDMVVGDIVTYSLRLRADVSAKKPARLGHSHQSRLGYTAWLRPDRTAKTDGAERLIHLSWSTLARYRDDSAKGVEQEAKL